MLGATAAGIKGLGEAVPSISMLFAGLDKDAAEIPLLKLPSLFCGYEKAFIAAESMFSVTFSLA